MRGFPDGSEGEESTCKAGDLSRSLGWDYHVEEGVATHSMENPMDRGAWWARASGVMKSRT